MQKAIPDDHMICGSNAERYAQIGNAVPVGEKGPCLLRSAYGVFVLLCWTAGVYSKASAPCKETHT
jgi:hypothetical protein